MKVFISQPMRGKTETEIKEARNEAEMAARVYLQEHFHTPQERIEFINTIFEEEPGKEFSKKSLWYLGKSIQFLGQADVAFFFGDWKKCNGCLTEHFAAEHYKIPCVDMSKG